MADDPPSRPSRRLPLWRRFCDRRSRIDEVGRVMLHKMGIENEDYEDDPYDPDEAWDEDEDYFDCGLMPDGQCTKAGSEECDWNCGALHGFFRKAPK